MLTRRSRRAFAALLALVVAGCASGTGIPAFTATFPPSSDGLVDPMEVSFIDQTGLVTGIAPAPGDAAGVHGAAPYAIAEPGDSNAVRIGWPGSDCDGRTSLVFVESGGGDYLVTIHVDPTPAGGFGCQQVDLARAVTVRLQRSIDIDLVTVTQQFP